MFCFKNIFSALTALIVVAERFPSGQSTAKKMSRAFIDLFSALTAIFAWGTESSLSVGAVKDEPSSDKSATA